MKLATLALPIIIGASVFGAAQAQAQDAASVWRFDPEKRVYASSETQSPGLADLERRILRLERGRQYHYYVVIVADTSQILYQLASDLHTRWSARKEFPRKQSFVVVCAAARQGVAILPPERLRNGLALSPQQLDRLLVRPYFKPENTPVEDRLKPAALDGLAKELGSLLEQTDKLLEAKESEREMARVQSLEAHQERSQRLLSEASALSAQLDRLEIVLLQLQKRGLDLTDQEKEIVEIRRLYAGALDSLSFAPERTAQSFARASDWLAKLKLTLNQLRVANNRIGAALSDVQANLDDLEDKLRAASDVDVTRLAEARKFRDSAQRALGEATEQNRLGRPQRALHWVERSRAALDQGYLQLAPPLPDPEEAEEAGDALNSPSWSLWAWLALICVALSAFLAYASFYLSQLRAENLVDSLRAATQRQADTLQDEIQALRKLYVQASRPAKLAIPERLLPVPPPTAKKFRGETAQHLARARARIEELHRLWCSMRNALLTSDVWRSQDRSLSTEGLNQSITILEKIPTPNLPVAKIRACAQQLQRITRSPSSCETVLEETAARIDHAEASLERVLQAGQSTDSLDDDYAELVQKALSAAHMAQTDPIGASRMARQAHQVGAQLDERVARTLDVAEARDQAIQRLDELRIDGRRPSAEQDLQALVTWSYHLADRVTQSLDEGARELASIDLERALALVSDTEALSQGRTEGTLDLSSIRAELHKAHESLKTLREEFAPESWQNIESALVRAAARAELLAEAESKGGRIPHLVARIHMVRRATLLASARLLQLRSERERAEGLAEELSTRSEAIRSYLEREGEAIGDTTLLLLEDTEAELDDVKSCCNGAAEEPPVWQELLSRLQTVEEELDSVRSRAGGEVLAYRRALVLRRSLERSIRESGDLIRRLDTTRPGATTRLEAAQSALKAIEGTALTPGADLSRALSTLQRGVRAAYQARDIADYRGLRGTIADRGTLGDAQHAVILANQEIGHAHRLYTLGLIPDPVEAWRLLGESRQLVSTNPARALELASQSVMAANESIAEGLARLAESEEKELSAEREEGRYERLLRQRCAGMIRTAERHRRARFEILGLGEEPDLAEGEDLDEEIEASELAALEEATEEEEEEDEEEETEEEAPAEEAPAEEDPAEEAPAEEAPAEEAPAAEEAPTAEEAPAEGKESKAAATAGDTQGADE